MADRVRGVTAWVAAWAVALACSGAEAGTDPVAPPPSALAPPSGLFLPPPPPPSPFAIETAPPSAPVPLSAPAPAPLVVTGPAVKPLTDSVHRTEEYGLKALFDSIHPPPSGAPSKGWYEKLSLRGYTQFRFDRTVGQDPNGAEPLLLGDRAINGSAENFFIRRARLILFGDVTDHLGIYIQPDFANPPPGSSTATNFGQLRDLYGDVYIDTDKVNRFRVGLSKVPFGFENMQSSQNRIPLDRTDAVNSAVAPNERDLGVFYYWTPEDKQKLLNDLVAGGLKGSGNYGIVALGVYNGQGGSQFEQNLNVHTVARVTWPFRLDSGQVIEASLQGYTGEYVVEGAEIVPLGQGAKAIPAGTRQTGDRAGQTDERIAATFVYYPQPFGFQTEWNVGRGPGLNDAQSAVITRPLSGGYVLAMYKYDSPDYGIVMPYARYQHYHGGYRSIANAPYGSQDQWDLGVEWHFRREMEVTFEYSFVDGMNLTALSQPGSVSYENFRGGLLRVQFQLNY